MKLTPAIAFFLMVVTHQAAMAQFVIEEKPPKPAVAKTVPRLTFEGHGDYAMARGMGRSIPVKDAVGQIVPKTWSVAYSASSADTGKLVTWRGGSEWPYTLEDALSQAGLAAVVNADEQRVTISRYQPVPEAGDSKAEEQSGPDQATVEKLKAEAAKEAKAIPKPVAHVWTLRADDQSIRGALQRWAKEAGKTISWECPYDYPIALETSFDGSFDDALAKLAGGLESAEKPIQVVYYENVIRIVPYGTVIQKAE